MAQENVEILHRAHEAFNRGDLDGFVADLAPEFEYFTSGVTTDIVETKNQVVYTH